MKTLSLRRLPPSLTLSEARQQARAEGALLLVSYASQREAREALGACHALGVFGMRDAEADWRRRPRKPWTPERRAKFLATIERKRASAAA